MLKAKNILQQQLQQDLFDRLKASEKEKNAVMEEIAPLLDLVRLANSDVEPIEAAQKDEESRKIQG